MTTEPKPESPPARKLVLSLDLNGHVRHLEINQVTTYKRFLSHASRIFEDQASGFVGFEYSDRDGDSIRVSSETEFADFKTAFDDDGRGEGARPLASRDMPIVKLITATDAGTDDPNKPDADGEDEHDRDKIQNLLDRVERALVDDPSLARDLIELIDWACPGRGSHFPRFPPPPPLPPGPGHRGPHPPPPHRGGRGGHRGRGGRGGGGGSRGRQPCDRPHDFPPCWHDDFERWSHEEADFGIPPPPPPPLPHYPHHPPDHDWTSFHHGPPSPPPPPPPPPPRRPTWRVERVIREYWSPLPPPPPPQFRFRGVNYEHNLHGPLFHHDRRQRGCAHRDDPHVRPPFPPPPPPPGRPPFLFARRGASRAPHEEDDGIDRWDEGSEFDEFIAV
ncbi:hypothetical protein JCM3766R1_000773 [Sporobolomyces carnicolor]